MNILKILGLSQTPNTPSTEVTTDTPSEVIQAAEPEKVKTDYSIEEINELSTPENVRSAWLALDANSSNKMHLLARVCEILSKRNIEFRIPSEEVGADYNFLLGTSFVEVLKSGWIQSIASGPWELVRQRSFWTEQILKQMQATLYLSVYKVWLEEIETSDQADIAESCSHLRCIGILFSNRRDELVRSEIDTEIIAPEQISNLQGFALRTLKEKLSERFMNILDSATTLDEVLVLLKTIKEIDKYSCDWEEEFKRIAFRAIALATTPTMLESILAYISDRYAERSYLQEWIRARKFELIQCLEDVIDAEYFYVHNKVSQEDIHGRWKELMLQRISSSTTVEEVCSLFNINLEHTYVKDYKKETDVAIYKKWVELSATIDELAPIFENYNAPSEVRELAALKALTLADT